MAIDERDLTITTTGSWRRTLGCAALVALLLAAVLLVRLGSSGGADAPGAIGADSPGKSALVGAPTTSIAPSVADRNAADAMGNEGGPTVRLIPPVSVTTPEVAEPESTPVDVAEPNRDPRNSLPNLRVVVTPEHPVEGDEVTVGIFWEDAEADLVVAESWCHPGDAGRPGLCADTWLAEPCPMPVNPLAAPQPGSGRIGFTFTASAGTWRWDHGAVLRSIPIPEDGNACVERDPFEDYVFVSGTIEVAPLDTHGDYLPPPITGDRYSN